MRLRLRDPYPSVAQVHLLYNGKTACIATSTVTIATPLVEQLFLDEKVAMDRCSADCKRRPNLHFSSEVVKFEAGKRVLWRRYYSVEGGSCATLWRCFERDMLFRKRNGSSKAKNPPTLRRATWKQAAIC